MISSFSTGLPIDAVYQQFKQALESPSPRILLRAMTGAGKSTGIPPMMLELGWGKRGLVIVVQPRRMAARMLARYVASKAGVKLGNEVGYVVRFDRRMSESTRLVFITDGILERWMTEDPELSGVSAVVFDEFHERHVASDLALGRVLDLQEGTRADLAVVVMSATLEVRGLKEFLGDSCVTLDVPGRRYPIEITYAPISPARDNRGRMYTAPAWEVAAKLASKEALKPDCGNILIFMPGAYEIRRTLRELERYSSLKSWELVALYGSLSPELQNRAVDVGDCPRIIVSTNIAETSLTIEGIRTVIDSGLVRRAQWDPVRNMDTLYVCKISQASASQRAGRAGRIAPGRCIRLWSKADHERRAEFDEPEIRRVDISPAVLILKKWAINDPGTFRWLTPPADDSVERAMNMLKSLGAVDDQGLLSQTGLDMLDYPLPPRLARLMVAGAQEQCVPEMAAIAALLQGEFVGEGGKLREEFRESDDYTDFQAEWRVVELAHAHQFNTSFCSDYGIMARACRDVLLAYKQLLSIGAQGGGMRDCPEPDWTLNGEAVVAALAESFLDNVGARHSMATNTCKLVGKRSGRISPDSVAYKAVLFVASEVAEVGGNGVETRVSRCTRLDRETLRKVGLSDFSECSEPVFDEQFRRVMSVSRTLFRDLTLDEKKLPADPSPIVSQILAERVMDGSLKLSCWDNEVEQWIYRLNALGRWMPELELPGFNPPDRLMAISMICEGAVSYKEIKDRAVIPILKEWLAPWQQDALDRYAPLRLKLCNGEFPKVHYEEDGTPTIALQVQKLFGVKTTPTVAEGRQKVKVSILAPNRRPWQITMSMEGFWVSGYPQMRKELAGRYPKHSWPTEP